MQLTKKQKEVLQLMDAGWELKEITYFNSNITQRHIFQLYKFRGIQGSEIKRINPKVITALVRKQYLVKEERTVKLKQNKDGQVRQPK